MNLNIITIHKNESKKTTKDNENDDQDIYTDEQFKEDYKNAGWE